VVLKTLLAQIGVEALVVEDGQLAVQAWREQGCDLILMDVHMQTMDGPTATRLIRAEEAAAGRARTPIIALTANAMSHQVAEYFAVGMDGFVAKPIDVARLVAAMEDALAGLDDSPLAASA
jgi:CheY-like chemotaxis protein